MDGLYAIILLIGGLGMFLYGMFIMADGLQTLAGEKLKKLIGLLTKNRFVGVLVGTIVTGIMQSSSACTVMIVGFVNAGIMNLSQATGVIMGANIGTTVTGWIVSSSEWFNLFEPTKMAPLAIGIGAFLMFLLKDEKKRRVGEIIIGSGLLFIGLGMMSQAILPYKDLPIISEIFLTLGKNPFLGLLAGAVITGIIQSSSAAMGIIQVLATQGLVPWNAAVYIILGQNIGTCATALLSSIGTSKMAKRAAVIHLLFNVIGACAIGILCILFFQIIYKERGNILITSTQISLFSSFYNIANVILLFGFANQLIALSGKIVYKKSKEKNTKKSA